MKKTVAFILALVLCLVLAAPALAATYKVSPVASEDVIVTDVELETDAELPEYVYLEVSRTTIPEGAEESLKEKLKPNQKVAEVVKAKLWLDTIDENMPDYPRDVSDNDVYFTMTATFQRKSTGIVMAVWAFDSADGWSEILYSASDKSVTCTFKTLAYDCIVFIVEDENGEPGGDTEPDDDTEPDGEMEPSGRKSPQTGDNSLWLICGTVSFLCVAGICCCKSRKIKD